MLQAKSKNRAATLAPFEQQDRDGVRPERPPPRAGRPPPRTVGGPIMGATFTIAPLLPCDCGGFPRGRRDPLPGLFLMGLVYLGGYFPTVGKLEQ